MRPIGAKAAAEARMARMAATRNIVGLCRRDNIEDSPLSRWLAF
jgi:hypothetical protein